MGVTTKRARRTGWIIAAMFGLILLMQPRARSAIDKSLRSNSLLRNKRWRRVLGYQAPPEATMSAAAEKSDPALWEKVKHDVTEGDRGGKPGQWSARKAQLAVHDYKAAGGDYEGPKTDDNHLHQWTEQHWGTKSGKPSGETGERYLPEKALEHLSDKEYGETTAKKQADSKKGKQFSAQPKSIARKTAQDRNAEASSLASLTRKDLLDRAAAVKLVGRTRMSKAQLLAALSK